MTASVQSGEFKLPRSAWRWVGVGLVLSSAVVVVISLYSGVNLSDLAKLGYLPFGLAAAASASRLFVQILRFRLVTRGFAEIPGLDMSGSAAARMGSEFVALSTPSMIGGPVLRAAWLSQKGVKGGTAVWIGYLEILMDIYVGCALAFVAAAYAFSRGAFDIGSTITVVGAILVTVYTLVFVVPAVKIIKVPHRIFGLASRLVGGPRAERLFLRAVGGSVNFSTAARSTLRKSAIPLIAKTLALTLVDAFLAGSALWLMLVAAGLKIDLFSATMVVFGVLTVAAIPISVGGSGLTEVTMDLYLTTVFGFSSWAAIVFWRIASFQIVLAVSGIAFAFLVRDETRRSSEPSRKRPPPENQSLVHIA